MTRATDLPKEARAFLDALAIGESGGADDDNAYSILFGGDHFSVLDPTQPNITTWPDDFPIWNGYWIRGIPTHAAGRYQFEPRTWAGLGGGSFDPVHQDHMAWVLACQVMVTLPGVLIAPTDGELQSIANRLHSTWTSLNPNTFSTRYRACLSAIQS